MDVLFLKSFDLTEHVHILEFFISHIFFDLFPVEASTCVHFQITALLFKKLLLFVAAANQVNLFLPLFESSISSLHEISLIFL